MTINIPDGGHRDVFDGEFKQMIEEWSGTAVELDSSIERRHGLDEGRSLQDVAGVLAYAHVAKAAFGLASAGRLLGCAFDSEEFGKRCARIAREQADRTADINAGERR